MKVYGKVMKLWDLHGLARGWGPLAIGEKLVFRMVEVANTPTH